MFDKMANAKIIKVGICFYDDITPHEVRIIEWHTWYGSGDYEDSPNVAENRDITCLHVWYEDLIRKGVFTTGGGQYLTVEEAVLSVEKNYVVKWKT